MASRTPQHELNELLQAELFHTLGSYGVVAQRLAELDRRMDRRGRRAPWPTLFPSEIVQRMRTYNEQLRTQLHTCPPLRSEGEAGASTERLRRHPKPNDKLLGGKVRDQWIVDFYMSSVAALRAVASAPTEPEEGESSELRMGRALQVVHEPQRRGTSPSNSRLIQERIVRNEERLRLAREIVDATPRLRTDAILFDHLGADEDEPLLHTHVIGALAEAHMRMHHAEHQTSGSFGDTIGRNAEIYAKANEHLKRSLVLNTFVYVAGRTVPWIFAEDELERSYVLSEFEHCCDTLTPTYCMWIGHQVSLLALHRRAYTWGLLGKPDRAYNDYDKVKRCIRGLEQRLDDRIAQAAGARVFLSGLAALAEHHSGRIYRNHHAHTAALRHFERAAKRLRRLEREDDPAVQEALRNSRWRVNLLMGQAKAYYELGQIKRSLLHYVYAWRAFLELADTENMAEANFEVVNALIAWLRDVEPDADLNKVELRRRLTPLVEQFLTVLSPTHLRLMAADVIMRLGHLLFMLKLPPIGTRITPGEPPPDADHELAYQCVLHAARLDPSSTLIATDLLKVRRKVHGPRARRASEEERRREHRERADIAEQWPAGGSQFEEAARVIEFELQTWLDERMDELDGDDVEGALALELLDAFLLHTDSSNVKLAQIYRYLMQESEFDARHDADIDATEGPCPSLELICMRRYSSFFPFLPRPSAFRVLGGGYLVRIPDPDGGPPFGIAVDPGPNFPENLYRCGYCLDDVHMVVVTHDHADHLAALDALLALFGNRDKLGTATFGRRHRRLAIVGNESVYQRYRFYNQKVPGTRRARDDAVSVFTFRAWADPASAPRDMPKPENVLQMRGWRLEPVKTLGHTDAHGHLAQGFLLTVGEGDRRASLLFISDAGVESLELSEAEARRDGCMALKTALREATIAVAHVSSVPLPELREIAGLAEPPSDETRAMTARFQALWNVLAAQTFDTTADDHWQKRRQFDLKQLQYGFHSRPLEDLARGPTRGREVSPLSPRRRIRQPSPRHLYLSGLLRIAEEVARDPREKLLLVGELREELGTFRNRIASALNNHVFGPRELATRALTVDIGLKVRLMGSKVQVRCTTCDLDNDRVDIECLHPPREIWEVCVKGEDEGIFYNCTDHDPKHLPEATWLERIERYDPFGR